MDSDPTRDVSCGGGCGSCGACVAAESALARLREQNAKLVAMLREIVDGKWDELGPCDEGFTYREVPDDLLNKAAALLREAEAAYPPHSATPATAPEGKADLLCLWCNSWPHKPDCKTERVLREAEVSA